MNNSIEERREARQKQTGENFTPAWLVQQMLAKLGEYSKESYQDPTFTFCDPAAGNGNMLLEVLRMKLDCQHDPLQALQTIYGTEFQKDNVKETRFRLLSLITEYEYDITEDMVKTVLNNIVLTCPPRYPNGSLDYDFDFPNKASQKDIDRWMQYMKSCKIEDLQNDTELDTKEPTRQEEFDEMFS